MKKKAFVLFVSGVMLLMGLMPQTALAATVHTVGNGDSFDIDTVSPGDTVNVSSGTSATIYSTSGNTHANVSINCGTSVKLTLQDVHIDDSAASNVCALSFAGAPNSLILIGENVIKSGANEPGIRVENAYLTITGSGSVTAHGGTEGAGIGSGEADAVGKIIITGGTINAYGHNGAAGIGGGSNADGGIIEISGGTVNAYGANEDFQVYRGGAGIGGGDGGNAGNITIFGDAVVTAAGGNYGAGIGSADEGDGGTIEISGGSITAQGGATAAGIGGGNFGDDVTITITGGTITSQGGTSGAGIGGGYFGNGGIIEISGGTIKEARGGDFAAGIGGGWNDNSGIITITGGTIILAQGGKMGPGIGGGSSGFGGLITIDGGSVTANGGNDGGAGIGSRNCAATINGGLVFASGSADISLESTLVISGDAGVFLENDIAPAASAASHIHFDSAEIENGKIYGVETPGNWTEAAAYIIPCILTYDANGGSGTAPDSETLHNGGTIAIAAKGDLENDNLTMVQWNTKSGGEGYGYYPGVDITMNEDLTLFAIWSDTDVKSVTINKNTLSMIHHDSDRLTAAVDPADATKDDVVWYSTDTDVAVVDQDGIVTATGVGSATIVAWADGVRDTCSVTVVKKPVAAVMLPSVSKTVEEGSSFWLKAVVSPSNATNGDVVWTSSNTSAATVSAGGVVTAVSEGSAVITAEADGKYDTCTVSVVKPKVTDISLKSTSKTMGVGDTLTLSGSNNEDVTWTSTNTSVATVSQGGKVTALSEGAASIIAEADGIYEVCTILVRSELSDDRSQADEGAPLDAYEAGGQHITIPNAGSAWDKIGPLLMWILIGIGGLGAAGLVIYLILRRRTA